MKNRTKFHPNLNPSWDRVNYGKISFSWKKPKLQNGFGNTSVDFVSVLKPSSFINLNCIVQCSISPALSFSRVDLLFIWDQ